MKIEFKCKKIKEVQADCEIVLVLNKKFDHKWIDDSELLEESGFKGEGDELIKFTHKSVVYVGVQSFAHDNLRTAMAVAMRTLKKTKYKSLKVGLYIEDFEESARAMVEGVYLGFYEFNKYKSKKEKRSLSKVVICAEEYSDVDFNAGKIRKNIKEGVINAQATNMVRDIVNQAPSEYTPVKMASEAKSLSSKDGLTVKVYGEKFLEKKNMGAFLAVSRASAYPPQLIHMIHKPKNAKKKIVLVGKGLTYDTGGLSLKSGDSMSTMKSDKSGGSAVMGIMKAVSELNLPYEVHGVIGAVENAIGQYAYKPDDVLVASNGKTIEVKNTDAEGRLVLADCLVYAQELKPDYIIDLATLTGACVVALGEYTIGAMGNDKEMKKAMIESGERSGELIAELPFNRYLKKLLKSEVADISNLSSSRYGGAITAGMFLSEFIEEKNKNKWVHLDIAGPAFVGSAWGCNPSGGSGAGVRLIVEWLKKIK